MDGPAALALLRGLLPVPPFPGSRPQQIFRAAASPARPDFAEAKSFIAAMRNARVGGTSWGAQPVLPGSSLRILRAGRAAGSIDIAADYLWPSQLIIDPWWLFANATELAFVDDDAAALLAAVAGVPLRVTGPSRLAPLSVIDSATAPDHLPLVTFVAELLRHAQCHDPLTGAMTTPVGLIEHFALWRTLIDANRPIEMAFGFARWKQKTAAPMLWDGQSGRPVFSKASGRLLRQLSPAAAIAVWKARIGPAQLAQIEASPIKVHEVEDGFIRSIGLGADCVPPLSIIVDPIGVHYDPSRPSGLETTLAAGNISPELLVRAAALRARLVASGVSKYGIGGDAVPRRGGERPHLLVIGQVEDDRSVRFGCDDIRTNEALLAAVRAREPDAWIVYRPHPDIEAGHRPGRISAQSLAALADEVAADASISGLIAMADQVHVMTSLAGFEALLHDKPVTTWGAPFYAGWGLTTDISPRWSRRRCSRTLEELIAATLFLYPRYVDPASGLPCSVEMLVDRLIAGVAPANSLLVRLRRWQGRGKQAMVRARDRLA